MFVILFFFWSKFPADEGLFNFIIATDALSPISLSAPLLGLKWLRPGSLVDGLKYFELLLDREPTLLVLLLAIISPGFDILIVPRVRFKKSKFFEQGAGQLASNNISRIRQD